MGNRTKLIKDGTTKVTYAYDIADKLTKEIEGQTTTLYSYHANGSLTKKNGRG